MSGSKTEPTLLRRVSHSMFWNAALLPAISVLNLAAAVLVRRYFGLESGRYDVLIGMLNTVLTYTGLGIPVALTQFVPQLEATAGRHTVAAFLRRAATIRLGLLGTGLLILNLAAAPVAMRMDLGSDGVLLVRLLSALAIIRAGHEFLVATLQSLLAHLKANLLQLGQALLLALSLAVTFALGGGLAAVLLALAVTGGAAAAVGLHVVRRQVGSVPVAAQPPPASASTSWIPGVPVAEFWRYSALMYVLGLSGYFVRPAFASTALGAAGAGTATVALFNVGFQFPAMIVVVLLASFQGLYRPLFARVVVDPDRDRVRTTFAEVSKVQAAILIPAAAGLAIMVADYVPLFFGAEFAPAVAIAQVLCVLMFAESLFNLGNILLSVEHHYGAVLATQSLRILAAPAFVWLAVDGRLVSAAAAFGVGRLFATAWGYRIARHHYGVQFPWSFAARVTLPSLLMAAAIGVGRAFWPTSWAEATVLTLIGAALLVGGLRLFRVLGEREIDLLRRADLPGGRLMLWLVAPVRPQRPRGDAQ